MPNATLNYRDIVKNEVSQFAVLLHAYQECSSEVQAIVNKMAAIATDEESTPDEKEHAVEVLIEALFPGFCVDVLSQFDDMRKSQSYTEAGRQLDLQEQYFSNKLRELMEERSINQQQLAEMTGVSQPAISNILSRYCRPQQRTVLRFAEVFQVDPDILWPPLPTV